MNTCPICRGAMKVLFTGWYCPNDCDKKAVADTEPTGTTGNDIPPIVWQIVNIPPSPQLLTGKFSVNPTHMQGPRHVFVTSAGDFVATATPNGTGWDIGAEPGFEIAWGDAQGVHAWATWQTQLRIAASTLSWTMFWRVTP